MGTSRETLLENGLNTRLLVPSQGSRPPRGGSLSKYPGAGAYGPPKRPKLLIFLENHPLYPEFCGGILRYRDCVKKFY